MKTRDDHTPIEVDCRNCENKVTTKVRCLAHIKYRGGIYCSECLSKKASERLKSLRSKETKEERSNRAKKARKEADCSKGVQKQWDNFRSNPEKFASICSAKADRMVGVWENYDDEQKNYIIKALYSSHGKGISAISKKMKDLMVEAGINNFISEEPFHGLIPDEINHDKKIIVELFGDAYHCNPRKFKDPDVYHKLIHKTVGEQWERDKNRIDKFNSYGYTTIVIWEYDLIHNPEKEINRIKEAMSLN